MIIARFIGTSLVFLSICFGLTTTSALAQAEEPQRYNCDEINDSVHPDESDYDPYTRPYAYQYLGLLQTRNIPDLKAVQQEWKCRTGIKYAEMPSCADYTDLGADFTGVISVTINTAGKRSENEAAGLQICVGPDWAIDQNGASFDYFGENIAGSHDPQYGGWFVRTNGHQDLEITIQVHEIADPENVYHFLVKNGSWDHSIVTNAFAGPSS